MTFRVEIPKDKAIDSSVALLKEGYRFLPNRRRKFQSDLFEVTLMGQKVICLSGPEAAEVFYDEKYFKRKGAAPKRIQKTLFGEQGVQTLDDQAHERRKTLFMSLFTEGRIKELKKLTENEWKMALHRWTYKDVNLFDETKKIMCRVACKWAAVPLKYPEIEKRAFDLWALVDAFGAAGIRHLKGRLARKQCNKWIENLITDIRDGTLKIEEGTPLYEFSMHEDNRGNLLDKQIAAVEVLNILRPIVAISLYVLFGALALYTHSNEREKIKKGGSEYTRMFTQEIRRYYPFTPFVGARVRRDFIWSGHAFKRNTLVLLDVYGMNHDERIWESPSEFRPERFKEEQLYKYEFIPQGGGEFIANHRCAGELVTITVMEESFAFLTKKITYSVPNQDVHFDLRRMPPKIPSGFIISNIKRA